MKEFYSRLTERSLTCDVLVVGSGPGGSGAAYKAASKGLDTVVIDKKTRIGSPVQCGEVMDPSLLEKFDIDIDPSIIQSRQKGTIFWINEKLKAKNTSRLWKSISLDRNRLDKHLAYKATKEGANIIADAELIDMKINNNDVESAAIKSSMGKVEIKPKVVIAADGTYSTVADLQGIRRPEKSEIGSTVSYEMTNLDLYDHKKVQMFFDEYTFGGYGYIIPKTKQTANVGLGKLGKEKEPWKSLEQFLNKNEIVKEQVKDAGILEVKKGYTPITGPNLPIFEGNVLYVGDAAGQNLSHVGEGTFPSYVCGRVAGRVASKAIKKENLNLLSDYSQELDKNIGPMLEECGKIRERIFEIYESDINREDKSFLLGLLAGEILPKDFDNLRGLCELSLSERVEKVSSIIRGIEDKSISKLEG